MILNHIHIENFRLFKNLDIPKVGQVNLITGKNNSGKTTLLEALRIYINLGMALFPPSGQIIPMILKERGDLNGNVFEGFRMLFHDGKIRNNWKEANKASINNDLILILDFQKGLVVQEITKKPPKKVREIMTLNLSSAFSDFDGSNFIPASFNLTNLHLWGNVELTEKEDKVNEILQILDPNIIRVSVNEADGSAKVRLKNASRPMPLKNFGEGMNRLFTVALGLVNAENNLLLIDEIDLGLHHSVQHLLWKIVFQKSKDLNVQVFATTHSSDCVKAFSRIANQSEYAGMGNYIRLQRSKKDGDIVAVDYEMEELESAMDLNLETR